MLGPRAHARTPGVLARDIEAARIAIDDIPCAAPETAEGSGETCVASGSAPRSVWDAPAQHPYQKILFREKSKEDNSSVWPISNLARAMTETTNPTGMMLGIVPKKVRPTMALTHSSNPPPSAPAPAPVSRRHPACFRFRAKSNLGS